MNEYDENDLVLISKKTLREWSDLAEKAMMMNDESVIQRLRSRIREKEYDKSH